MIDRNDEPRDDESRGSFVGKNRACSVGEFFKGWRRKAGLVTLAMACVLAVGWMRSYCWGDYFSCGIVSAVSGEGVISFSNAKDDTDVIWGTFPVSPGRGHSIHKGAEIPYSIVVVSLTLLSAWLIFAKPRKAKAVTGSTP